MSEQETGQFLCDYLSGAVSDPPSPQLTARLAARAREEGVGGVLYSRLKSLDVQGLDDVKRAHYHTSTRNVWSYHELGRIVAAFESEQISYVLLKGACLAGCYYHSLSEREVGDFDILVPREQVHRSAAALKALGYATPESFDYQSSRQNLEHHHLPPLVREGSPIWVELHWQFVPPEAPYTVDIEGVFSRARGCSLRAFDGMVPSPEDLLFHVALHAAYNSTFEAGIRQLCDIRIILDRSAQGFDWKLFRGICEAARAARPVALSMALAHDLMEVSLPASQAAAYRDDVDDAIFQTARRYILTGVKPTDGQVMRIVAGEKLSPVFVARCAVRRLREIAVSDAESRRAAIGHYSGLLRGIYAPNEEAVSSDREAAAHAFTALRQWLGQ